MSAFDENSFTAGSESSTNQDTSGYGAAEPRPESPYVDSPYTSYRQPQSTPGGYYQPPQYTPPKKERKSHGSFWKSFVAVMLTVALVAGGCVVTAKEMNRRWEKRNWETVSELETKIQNLEKQLTQATMAPSGGVVAGSPVLSDGYLTPGQVYAQNVDSVVSISSTIRSTIYGRTTEGTASGSGFILTDNGFVATNYHVIEDATAVTVSTHSGEHYTAKVVGSDSTIDLAVLKIEAENLPAVILGSSEDLAIGDMVVAIGNPLGELAATQTVGYVSGKNREVTTNKTAISMIQTDAAINPGNSGGPLFNMKGEVVGITTAKYSGTTSGGATIEGIGFAIPMDDITNIIQDLKNLGYVTGAYLGVTVKDMNSEYAEMYNLPLGAYVATTVEGGSADRAGIQPKDIITQIGDYTVTGVTELTRALRAYRAGDTVTVTLFRSGQKMELELILDERPQNIETEEAEEDQPDWDSQNQQDPYEEWFDYFRRFFQGIG